MKIFNKLLLFFYFPLFCFCQKNTDNKINNNSDSLIIVENIIKNKYDSLIIKNGYLNKYKEINFPFDINKPNSIEKYLDFFLNKNIEKDSMPFTIISKKEGDINNDNIQDIILIIDYDDEISNQTHTILKNILIKYVDNNLYFTKNNNENYIKLIQKTSPPRYFPLVILLGEKNNTYKLGGISYLLLTGFRPSVSIEKKQIHIVNPYSDLRAKDLMTEFSINFIYNSQLNDWIVESSNIHFWSSTTNDVDYTCFLKKNDTQGITFKTFSFEQSIYKISSHCFPVKID